MNEDVKIDLNFLTEDERDVILSVIRRDDEFRKHEKERIRQLKHELEELREPESGVVSSQSQTTEVCSICLEDLGFLYFFTSGLCPKCQQRTCKQCRKPLKDSWQCYRCHQLRAIKAQSGAWFYEKVNVGGKNKVYGSTLIRASLRRSNGSKTSKGSDNILRHELQPLSEDNMFESSLPLDMEELAQDEGVESISEEDNESISTEWTNNNETEAYRQANESENQTSEFGRVTKQVSLDSEGGDSLSSGIFTPSAQEDAEDSHYGKRNDISVSQKVNSPAHPVLNSLHAQGSDEDEEVFERQYYIMEAEEVDFIPHKESFKSISMTEEEAADETYHTPVDDEQPLPSSCEHRKTSKSPNPSLDVLALENESSEEEEDEADGTLEGRPDLGPVSDEEEEIASEDRDATEYSTLSEEYTTPPKDHTTLPEEYSTPLEDWHSVPSRLVESEGNREMIVESDTSQMTPVVYITEVLEDSLQDSVSLNSPGGEVAGVTSEPESDQHAEQKYYRETERYNQPDEPSTHRDDLEEPPSHYENLEEEDVKEDDIGSSFAKKYGGGSLDSLDVKDKLSMGSRESIISTYSNAGDNIHSPVPVTGDVYFGINYDFKKSVFEVQIHRAQGLAAVDTKKNRSDPYIKTYLLPDRTKSGKRKTKVKRHTVNPEFDEILKYKVKYDDLLLRTLWLTVWNSDRFGHNAFLGEVLLSVEQYQDAGFVLDDPTPQWYPLHERDDSEPLVSYHGEVLVALKFVPPEAIITGKKQKKKHNNGQLHVHIKEAKNLIPKDDNGFSDPFCKIYFLPDKSKKTKQKTPVIKKTINPSWNYQFLYDNVTWDELKSRGLEITVWDYDMGTSNDFLGGSRLGLGTGSYDGDDARDEEVSLWRSIIDKPNQWAEKLVSLRASMEHRIQ